MGQEYSRHNGNTHLDNGFEAIINFGYGFGIDHDKSNLLDIDILANYRFNNYFTTGLGVGYAYYHEVNTTLIPIYLHLQSNLTKTKVSPYLACDIGFSLGKTTYDPFGVKGFYLNPGVGMDIWVTNSITLNLCLSYRMQHFDNTSPYSEDIYIILNACNLSFGIVF